MRQAPPVDHVSLFRVPIPAHFQRVGSVNLRVTLRIVTVEAGFRPAHAAHDQIAEGVAFLVLSVALLAKPLRRRRQEFVFLHHALPARQELHFLPVADFLTGYAVDRRSYAVENDDRALCILQNRLVIVAQLLAGLKVEIFPRLAAPVDLALAVVIGLYLLFQPGKERVRVGELFARSAPEMNICRQSGTSGNLSGL